MNQASKIEIPVEEATAAALPDARRREAVGRLVDRLVRPDADDPLIALFERTAAEAQEVGLTEAEVTEDRRRGTLELLAAAALWIEPKETANDCRDAKDNRCLELALSAQATTIVSGDEDLLVLDPWRGVRVLRPTRCVEEFGVDKP